MRNIILSLFFVVALFTACTEDKKESQGEIEKSSNKVLTQTKEKLNTSNENLSKQAEKSSKELKSELNKNKNDVEKVVSNVVGKTKEMANDVKDETSKILKDTVSTAKEITSEVVKDVKNVTEKAVSSAVESTTKVVEETSNSVKKVVSNIVSTDNCSKDLKYNFTFYGGADKAYVVTKNTFKKSTSIFPNSKLLNATLSIDALSIDTSADLSNKAAKWPPAMAIIRNNNVINHFFKKFDKDIGKIDVKIVKIDDSSMDLEFKMNGLTKLVPFSYKTEDNMIKASGKLDVLDFDTKNAWSQFSNICKGFHYGKSWSEIEIFFEVPSNCK